MDAIHLLLAYATVAAVVVGLSWSTLLVTGKRPLGPSFERFQAAVVSLVIVAAVSGAVLLAAGARPADGLHLLYAAVAVAVIPLARSFLARAGDRRAAALLLVGFVALGAMIYRLFTTG